MMSSLPPSACAFMAVASMAPPTPSYTTSTPRGYSAVSTAATSSRVWSITRCAPSERTSSALRSAQQRVCTGQPRELAGKALQRAQRRTRTAAAGCDDVGACGDSELHGKVAGAARCGGDEHGFSGGKARGVAERRRRSHATDGARHSLGRGGRHAPAGGCVGDDVLGEGALRAARGELGGCGEKAQRSGRGADATGGAPRRT
jgi:hypothetical protein